MKDFKRNEGITLIALIITVIILVILAAVSVRAITNMKIVEYAVNGSQNYVKAGKEENKMLDDTAKKLEDTIEKINDIQKDLPVYYGKIYGSYNHNVPNDPLSDSEYMAIEMMRYLIETLTENSIFDIENFKVYLNGNKIDIASSMAASSVDGTISFTTGQSVIQISTETNAETGDPVLVCSQGYSSFKGSELIIRFNTENEDYKDSNGKYIYIVQ